MGQNRFFLFTLAFVVTIALATAQAGIKDRPYSIYFVFGGAQPVLNNTGQMWLLSPQYGGNLQYMLSQQTGIVATFRYTNVNNDSLGTPSLRTGLERANRKWSITSLSVGPKFYLHRRKGLAPYLVMTADAISWNVVNRANNQAVLVTSLDGGTTSYSAWELGGTGGLGLEKLFGQRVGFSIEADFSYLTGVNTNFAPSVVNSRSRGVLQIVAALSVHFGGKSKRLLGRFEEENRFMPPAYAHHIYRGEIDRVTADTVFIDEARVISNRPFVPITGGNTSPEQDGDRDGVVDRVDKCPDTPIGAFVDSTGCPNDSDRDGVFDGIDECPSTPTEAIRFVDQSGCPIDFDNDEVPDYLDDCPDTPFGATVDSRGCPVDGDKDGVSDGVDLCPDTPLGVPIDNKGCPDMASMFYTRILRPTYAEGKTILTGDVLASLDSVARYLQSFPDVSGNISGYTEDAGPAEENRQISWKRAEAIKQFLVAKGVAAVRLQAIGYGEAHSIDTNRTLTGSERNRRIEIEFNYPWNFERHLR